MPSPSKLRRFRLDRTLMSAAVAAEFYKEHSGREFFKGLVDFMSSGPALAMVLMRPGAISAWRALLGPTSAPCRGGCRAAAPPP